MGVGCCKGVVMNLNYTATIFCEEEIIAYKHGDDIEDLYLWMLTQAKGKSGSLHGQILEVKTNTVIRKFRKTSME
jgi:hypothetical protein